MNKPRIVITMGDPKGIGPEVVKKALKDVSIKGIAHYIVLGGKKGLPVKYIDEAVRLIKNKEADALVTAPVNKEAINRQGINFKGHTEYLAGLTGVTPRDVLMMFAAKRLRVSLVTRHIPIKKVPRYLNIDDIVRTIYLSYQGLKNYFRIMRPKIGVCGLNPHSGEGGFIGDEEERLIIPAIEKARFKLNSSSIYGPCSAESLFYDAYRGKLDAVAAMFHDQGLVPLKMVARDYAVNITFGLPFIRTSPDHGTAYDIAGKDVAEPGSMIEAIRLAVRFVETEKKVRAEFFN